MNAEADLTRAVRSWLEEGVTELPDRILDDVLARVPVTPQRRPLWRTWRTPFGQGVLRFAAAALAVVVMAGVAFAVYVSRPEILPAASPSPQPTILPTEPPSPAPAAPTPSPRVGRQGRELEPGRYYLYGPVARVSTGWPTSVILALPTGWTQGSPERNVGFTKYSDDGASAALASISGSSVEWVPASPCQGSIANRIGRSVSDLLDALRRMPVVTVADPTPISVDGYGGFLVRVEVPDTSDCEVATFWRGPQERNGESSTGGSPRGWSNDIYVLDLDGTRWVFQAAFAPSATDELRAEVGAMIQSIDIVAPIGPMLAGLDMPGFSAAGAGWYGWTGGPSDVGWMHWVVGESPAPSHVAAEMFFAVGPDCLALDGSPVPTSIQIGGLTGITLFPYEAALPFRPATGDEVVRAYRLDVEGSDLCAFLKTSAETTAAELVAAEAVVQSILAVRLPNDQVRIIFNLPDGGWDTG